MTQLMIFGIILIVICLAILGGIVLHGFLPKKPSTREGYEGRRRVRK